MPSKPHMLTARLGAIIAGGLILGAASLVVLPAHALVISETNSTFGAVDAAFGLRTFMFGAGDFPGSSIVTKVTIEIDFSKCGANVASTGCTGGSSTPFANEIGFALESPMGTRVALVENDGNDETWETGNFETYDSGDSNFNHIVILFDDTGMALGNLPASGTFAPEGMLSAFNSQNAIGTWTLFFEDDTSLDPLGFHAATLNIEVADSGLRIPEPGTLALFGLGLAGLGIARRRKAA